MLLKYFPGGGPLAVFFKDDKNIKMYNKSSYSRYNLGRQNYENDFTHERTEIGAGSGFTVYSVTTLG